MKNKLAKSMSMIIAIAMLISMVPAVVSADEASINIDSVVISGDTVTVTYDAAGLTEFTLLAVRDASEYVSVADLPDGDADLEKQIEYIDQPTLSANAENATFTFKLRDRSDSALAFDGQYVNVLLGGEGVTAVVKAGKELLAAPDIEEPTETTVFSDEEIVFAVTGGSEAWASGASVYVNGASEAYTGALDADGETITITSTENVTSIKVVNEDYNDATWTGTVTVLDRLTEAKKAIGTATVVYDTDDNSGLEAGKAKITIPEDTTDATTSVAIAYTLKKGDDVVTVEDLVAIVDRPAQDATEPDVYTLVATLSHDNFAEDATVESTFRINPVGADGPEITAADVTILRASGAYGDATKALIKVVTSEVSAAEATLMVGDAELYWSPQKEAFYGVIASKIDDVDITAEAVAAALSEGVVEGASESFNFGVIVSSGVEPDVRDFGYAGRLSKGNESPSAKQYIALDVNDAEPNGLFDVRDFGAHGRKTKGTAFPVLAQ